MTRIEEKFRELKKKNDVALVTYVTAGDPSLEATLEILLRLEESGADIIELGIPFSDPMADGPIIQAASERALSSYTTLEGILEVVHKFRNRSDLPLILFGYYNPFFSYGVEKFSKEAQEAGVDGILVVDLPPEEADEIKEKVDNAGLNMILLLAPTSTEERIKLVAEKASGFVYLVSVTGVTGIRPDIDYSLEPLVSNIRKNTNLPVGIGFGVSKPEQAERIAKFADAVIVGSSIVKIIEGWGNGSTKAIDDMSRFVKGLTEACKRK